MRRTTLGRSVVALSALAMLAACSTDESLDDPAVTESAEEGGESEEGRRGR